MGKRVRIVSVVRRGLHVDRLSGHKLLLEERLSEVCWLCLSCRLDVVSWNLEGLGLLNLSLSFSLNGNWARWLDFRVVLGLVVNFCFILMFLAHLRLLGAQLNPKPSYSRCMLRLFNQIVICHLNALSRCPDRIKAPSASSLDEHAVKEAMNQREELALVTKEAHDDQS